MLFSSAVFIAFVIKFVARVGSREIVEEENHIQAFGQSHYDDYSNTDIDFGHSILIQQNNGIGEALPDLDNEALNDSDLSSKALSARNNSQGSRSINYFGFSKERVALIDSELKRREHMKRTDSENYDE